MKSFNFVFISTNKRLCDRWNFHNQKLAELIPCNHSFEVYNLSIDSFVRHTSIDNTAFVSPTNSLGYMGGGYDKALLNCFTQDYKLLESKIQALLLNKNNGYTPLTSVNVIDVPDHDDAHDPSESSSESSSASLSCPKLILIPSMVIPERIASPHVIFDSVWNLLLHLSSNPQHITNIVLPGIGGGYGHVDPDTIARLMIGAIYIYSLESEMNRLSQLKKSILILFWLGKDYRKFENTYDINELETHIVSDFGKSLKIVPNTILDWDALVKCIKW